MSKPITKIIITLQSQDALKDIWKLFDYVITKMEELGQDGMPKVDAQERKKFRAEVLKAPEGTALEVFRRWVTILVPEMVPVTPNLIQQIMSPPVMVDPTSLEQAAVIGREEAEQAKEDKRKAEIAERRRAQMAVARAALVSKKKAVAKGKSHHKKPPVEGV
ncbi:MAG: hypothetical protein WC551_09260 [Patescibacteria group bacterium]